MLAGLPATTLVLLLRVLHAAACLRPSFVRAQGAPLASDDCSTNTLQTVPVRSQINCWSNFSLHEKPPDHMFHRGQRFVTL